MVGVRPTQKPVALLERIIQALSNEGDVVLDPCRGCGTTIVVSEKLNWQWIGIDVTHLAVGLMKLRLKDSFGMVPVGTRVSSPSVSSPHVSKGNAVIPQAGSHLADADLAPLDPNVALTYVRATDTEAAAATYRVIGQPEDLDGAKNWR